MRIWQIVVIGLGGAVLLSGPAFAQVNSDYPQRHGGATADNPRAANNPDAVSSGMLHQTASAYARMQRRAEVRPLTGAEQESEIKTAGLSPVQYKHVMLLVQTDKTLRKEFIRDVHAEGGHVPAHGEIPSPDVRLQ